MGKSINELIEEFLRRLKAINDGEEARLSAVELQRLKPVLEKLLKDASNVTDVEVVISIDDLDEFDGETAA